MDILKQRILNIRRDYTGKRSKIEEEALTTMSEYEAKILKAQKEMEEKIKKLQYEEEKALSIVESQVTKKLISDAILNSAEVFEDVRGRKWRKGNGEWSKGSYRVHDSNGDGNSWFGDTFGDERREFTPRLIKSQLERSEITYRVSDGAKFLVVTIKCPENTLNGYNDAIKCPEMTFTRDEEKS